jgi:methylmalonyl-CoA mutase N-terminal domain/subunit
MFIKKVLDEGKELEERWQEEVSRRYKGKDFQSTTRSGIPIKAVYGPQDIEDINYRDIGWPGEYPYTRGLYPILYQYQPLMKEQLLGYGVPEQLRERMDLLIKEGAEGYFGRQVFNIAFDQASHHGYDPDDRRVVGRIGDSGVSVCKVDDFETLFRGIDLAKTNVVLNNCNGAPVMLALYIVAAERLGFPKEILRGNSTNYLYTKWFWDTESFLPRNAMKVIRELIKYCSRKMPMWNTLTITPHNMEEAGATAVQALAFSLAVFIAITEECLNVGLKPDEILPRIGFHTSHGNDFFEDICKVRALRRMYAKINKDKFGCRNDKSLQARIFGQTAGSTLTAQQPMNNIIRSSIHALGAILAGVNGLTVDAYDEALNIPTEEAVTLSLRTEQIILEETEIPAICDPLAGSYYVEWLTNKLEEEAYKILSKINDMGGYVKCWESGWLKSQVDNSAYNWRKQVDSGERVIIGVNKYVKDKEEKFGVFQHDPEAERIAIDRVRSFRERRNNARTRASLEDIRNEAKMVADGDSKGDLMPAIIEGVKAGATLGETTSVLREVFGYYR